MGRTTGGAGALFASPALAKAAILVVALVSQGCSNEPDAGGALAPIVDGRAEPGMDAVVLLFNFAGNGCTASVVAPRAVLTAKHCVERPATAEDPNPMAPGPASNFLVFVGSSVRNVTAQYTVQEVRPAAGGWSTGQGADLAMLILSRPVRGVEPLELSFDDGSPLVGQTFTAVGYGDTPQGVAGVKHRTEKRVSGLEQGYIMVEPSICKGDSGGPLIGPDGRVWGVASFGIGAEPGAPATCGTARGAYNGIERFRDFIETAIEDSGTCVPDGDEVCNGNDDDCDGELDEGCTAVGEPCTSDDECVGGEHCEPIGAGRICSQPCDPLQPEMGCPPGMYCASSEGCDGRCVHRMAAGMSYGIGQDCESDTECASLFCHDPGDGRRRCLQPCRGDGGRCLAGEVCAAAAGECGGCLPEGLVISARGLGEPCRSDDDCGSGPCFAELGLRYCSRACTGDEDCESGFHCRQMGDDTGDGRALCIRGPREGLGGGCVHDGDCADDHLCAARGDARWCTELCEGECPEGFVCSEAGGVSVCAPVGGLVGEPCGEGTPECISGLCEETPAGRVCTRLCSPDRRCSAGFECTRVDDGGTAVCVRPSPPADMEDDGSGSGGGGCAIGVGQGAPAGGGPIWVLGTLLVWFGWRRRCRGRRGRPPS